MSESELDKLIVAKQKESMKKNNKMYISLAAFGFSLVLSIVNPGFLLLVLIILIVTVIHQSLEWWG